MIRYTEDKDIITILSVDKVSLPCVMWYKKTTDSTYSNSVKINEFPYEIFNLATGVYNVLFQDFQDGDKSITDQFVVKGTEPVGRYFKTYKGDQILTADDIKYHFLKDVNLNRSDETIEMMIDSALSIFETEMRIFVKPRRILTHPEIYNPSKVLGQDYEMEDDGYPLHRTVTSISLNRTRYKPVLSVQRIDLYNLSGAKVRDLLPWLRFSKKSGQIEIFPVVGVTNSQQESTVFGVSGWLLSLGIPEIVYQNAIQIDYTAGMRMDMLPTIYYQIIGMITSILLLIPVSQEERLGWNSVSMSIDGISQSISGTQGLLYMDRINEYKEYVKDFFSKNRYQRGYSFGHV
jgi:hypothetical protein